MLRRVPHSLAVTVGHLALDPRRLTYRQAAGRNDGPLQDYAADGHTAAPADFRAVHDNGTHADQAIVLDARPMDDRPVPQRDAVAERARKSLVGMQHAAVLHVRLPADAYRRRITADHCPEPDARRGADGHVTYDHRAGSNVRGRVNQLRAKSDVLWLNHRIQSLRAKLGTLDFGPWKL